MTLGLLSDATGAVDGKGHNRETAGAPSSLPHTALADLERPRAGEGVIQNSSGRSRAGHFPPRTAGGSIAYVFTPKQQVATFSQL